MLPPPREQVSWVFGPWELPLTRLGGTEVLYTKDSP